jgi:hypothetical protein
VEALTSLANLLWEEPDRRTKEESLRLLDRAALLRPDLRGLLRLSADRWAELGDAPKALERLDRFLEHASAQERSDAAALREALSRRVRGAPEEPTPALAAPEEPASAAIDRWRKAQVYRREAPMRTLSLACHARRSIPPLARVESAASLPTARGEWREAEAAPRRAVAGPARLSPEPRAPAARRGGRRALDARRGAGAGSSEALLVLARRGASIPPRARLSPLR